MLAKAKRSPPTTHRDAQIIISTAMVNVSVACHYSDLQMLPSSGAVLCCDVELEILEVRVDQRCYALWDVEEIERHPKFLVWH